MHDSKGAPRPPRDRLPVADSLRGLAALWVVLFHLKEGRHIESLVRALPDAVTAGVFSAGHLGVAIFFVLSGLVIAYSGAQCGASALSLKNFLVRRLLRLCPPYYFSMAVVLVFLLIKARATHQAVAFPSMADIGVHLLFLQDLAGVKPLSTVYWTLCIEVQFYIVFGCLMLAIHQLQRVLPKNHAFALVMTSACALAALWPLGLADKAFWHASFLPTWHLFLLGVLVHFALKGGKHAFSAYLLYVLILSVAGVRSHDMFTLAGVVTSVVLVGASRLPLARSETRFRVLPALGLISYSLYLLHNPVTGAALDVTRRLLGHGLAADIIGALLSLAACLAAATIAYMAIERPAIKWAGRSGSPPARVAPIAGHQSP